MTASASPSPGSAPTLASSLLAERAWIPLALLGVLGFVLRWMGIGEYWTNPDEGIYFSMVTWEHWDKFWAECLGNAHPPLFYLILRGLSSVTEDNFVALRWVSLLGGTAWIPGIYLCLREAGSRSREATLAGLIAAALVTISPGSIMLAQILRPYALLGACLTFGLYFLLRYLRRGGTRALWAYCLFMWVALWTHYSTLLFLGTLALALLGMLALRRLAASQVRGLLLANAPLLLTFVFLYFWHLSSLEGSDMQKIAQEGWLRPYMLPGLSSPWLSLLGFLSAVFTPSWGGPMLLLFVGGIGLAVWRRDLLMVLLPLAAWVVAAALAMTSKYPFGASRHSFYLVTVLLLPIAYLGAAVFCRGKKSALISAAVGLCLLWPMARATITGGMHFADARGKPLRVGLLTEYTVRYQDMAACVPQMQAALEVPGLLLLSDQSYNLLMPLYYRIRQRQRVDPETGIKRFDWGRRKVLSVPEWNFSDRNSDVFTHRSVSGILRRIDARWPELRIAETRDLLVMAGGWQTTAGVWLLRMQPEVARLAAGVERFMVFSLDAARYLELVEAALREYDKAATKDSQEGR